MEQYPPRFAASSKSIGLGRDDSILRMAGAGALSGAIPGQTRPVERTADVANAASLAADAEMPVRSLSFLIPARNEEGNIGELYRRLSDVLARIDLPYEIIFIDDGSTDNTWGLVRELRAGDERMRGIRHRRNFGKAQALANGFAVAGGDVIVTMDADLQDDPDELPNFLAKLNEGYDLVSGWKQRRKDPLGKTFPSKIFNRTVRSASGVPLHDFNCGYKAYRREVAQSIRLYGELHRFTPVLAHAQGFRIGEIPVKHHARTWGQSKYGWSRLVKGFLDLLTVVFLTQYRQRPMHLFGLPGLLALGLGVAHRAVAVGRQDLYRRPDRHPTALCSWPYCSSFSGRSSSGWASWASTSPIARRRLRLGRDCNRSYGTRLGLHRPLPRSHRRPPSQCRSPRCDGTGPV